MDFATISVCIVLICVYAQRSAIVASCIASYEAVLGAIVAVCLGVFSGAKALCVCAYTGLVYFGYYGWRCLKAPLTLTVFVCKKFIPDRNLETVILKERPFEVVRGDLVFENGKFYTKVNMGDYDLKIKMNGSSLFALSKQGDISEGNECMMPGSSSMTVANLPPGQLALLDGERVLGLGVRCVVDGCDGLLSAAHVISALQRATTPRISNMAKVNGAIKAYAVPRDWTISTASRKLDMAVLDVPTDVFSKLGVAKAKLGRLPGTNSPITITRWSPSGFTQSSGRIVKTGMFFTHSASTLEGTSGAPIFWNGKVVGLHVRGDLSDNTGVALDVLLRRAESDVRDSALSYSDYVVDPVEYDLLAGGVQRKVLASKNVFTLSDMKSFESRTKAAGKKLWHEMDFDSDDEFGFESGRVPVEEVVIDDITPVKARAVESVPKKNRKSKTKARPKGDAPKVTGKNESAEGQDFQLARVRGSPPTSASTNGTAPRVTSSKSKTLLVLPKSAQQQSGSAPASNMRNGLLKASTSVSLSSEDGSGPSKIPKQSTIRFGSMPEALSSVSSPVNTSSAALSQASVKATQASESTQALIVASAVSSLSNSRLARKRRALRQARALDKKQGDRSL